MVHNIKPLPEGLLEIGFILTDEEKNKFEARALKELAKQKNFPGFRPGHAPIDKVRASFGEQAITEEILLQAARELYPNLVREQKLQVIGRPKVDLKNNNPFTFLTTVAKLPEVVLGDFKSIKIKREVVTVATEQIDNLITEVLASRAKEELVERSAQMDDLVEIDFEVLVDSVVIEGGSEKNYPLILGKKQMVPGFEEAIVGLQAGAEKEFQITFPENYKIGLAGRTATVKLKLSKVFARILPELNDEFVKSLGRFESVQDFKDQIKNNLQTEAEFKADNKVEREMLEEIFKVSEVTEVPEILRTSETRKMIAELKTPLSEKGIVWEDYLRSIKKSESDLQTDLKPQAEKRVKLALLIQKIAGENNLEANEEQVEEEIIHTLEHHVNDERMVAQLQSDDYKFYVREILTNRNVIKWLKVRLVE
ncbi:MAG: trigger factor [Patescibacteria group bacterium]|mgnify:CR=1 FL=1